MKEICFLYLLIYMKMRIKQFFLNGVQKSYFLTFIIHISTNNMPDNLRFCIHVDNVPPEGTVSQVFDKGLSFHFMSKNR